MRILELRFKNLNSLVGDWRVDLTQPEFTADGIFVITGPTGAGKTTILDAICLALYGRTPRLNKVTKSGNEIMSRQTGECSAEVVFETQSGRYRCHWSQHRARKKPGGELQAPKHEIADADSGKIHESKIRGVADRIAAATGMDFERFTRSMLLAQGGFAAFLQAPADERAPILEQITGTEIYSHISVRVHERRSEERKTLDGLQAELAGMALLTPEDEQHLGESLARQAEKASQLGLQITGTNKAIAWLEGITSLREALRQLETDERDWRIRAQAFGAQQKKLNAATQALELAGDFATLTSMRGEQESEKRNLGKQVESLPVLEEAASLAAKSEKAAVHRLNQQKAEQRQALPVIRQVREKDQQISNSDALIKAAAAAIAETETSLQALRTAGDRDEAELRNGRPALADLLRQLDATKADQGLVEQLTGIRERFEVLRNLQRQSSGKSEEIESADGELRRAAQLEQQRAASLGREKQRCDEIQELLTEKQSALKESLEGDELSTWRHKLLQRVALSDRLGKAIETAQSGADSKRALEELCARETILHAESSRLTEQHGDTSEKQAALEKETALLETQLTLLRTIEGMEQARHQLRDGQPCPLCGAEEHPYAEGNIPVADETDQRLHRARAKLKAEGEALSTLKVKLAQTEKDLEQVARDQRTHAENVEKTDRLIVETCTDLSVDARDPDPTQTCKRMLDENVKALDQTSRVVQAAEALEKARNKLLESLETAKESVTEAERQAQSAAHMQDLAAKTLTRLHEEATALKGDREQSLEILVMDVRAFGVDTLSMDELDSVQAQLATRREQWITRVEERGKLERKITALEMTTRHQAEQIRNATAELEKQQHSHAGVLGDREAWREQRRALFEEKNPDDEEARLSAAADAAAEALQGAQHELNAANQALGQLKSAIEALEKSTRERDRQLGRAQEAFSTRLSAAGFAGEAGYKAACLTEDERTSLAELSRKLADEETELASMRKEKTKLLEIERQKRLTEQPLDELKETSTTLLADDKELQQEMGGIRRKLEDNQSLKQRHQERARTLDAQKRECSRWDLLHELIGSADGKKYRNFAQGITFEMMVGHANRQLRKMTDRYLLIRDDRQPLELNVIDAYQAAEVRSTKNLSGGESFIVSLALALGLSHMASRNVRVDSLFLDEGFGTLDEEALDTALDTLAGLRRDGKLIGVISHVQALKDRIGTQIQVSPATGGRSVLSGPGCAKEG